MVYKADCVFRLPHDGQPYAQRQPETLNGAATAHRQNAHCFKLPTLFRLPIGLQSRLRFSGCHCPSFARAGVSPPTTSRGKPLHPAQSPPFLASFQAALSRTPQRQPA
ncbi:hypothetical protein [Kingella bonacorsii]|uniref:Uncharacterized protein n=1 Tax=Kingella bonacorsii TaxID=2796361 RepID=A0ABS1BTA7_9NEIS|nr:hypothetical protein [Kingella bonacorsii]MBK0396473.1 hypothetical protein [Kingella bonacorsii]